MAEGADDIDPAKFNKTDPFLGDDGKGEKIKMTPTKSKRPTLALRGDTKDNAINVSSTSKGGKETSYIDESQGARLKSLREKEYKNVDLSKLIVGKDDNHLTTFKLRAINSKTFPLYKDG